MKLRDIRIGEALLWLGFVFCFYTVMNRGENDAVTMAGLFVLAAIGVRATRPIQQVKQDDPA